MNQNNSEHCKGPTSRKEREKWGTPSVHDAGRSAPPAAILRKRIIGVFIIVLTALMLAAYVYCRSGYLRRGNDWTWFWVGEAIVGVLLVLAVVQVLRKGP